MLSHMRAVVLGASFLLVASGLLACQVGAAEPAAPAALASAAPSAAPPVLLAQYWGNSHSRPSSSGGVHVPYGIVRLVVLSVIAAGGWLSRKFYM
jgi:hypothetical protein